MNGVEFEHRVLKQWSRDPGFYNLSDGIYPRLLVHHSKSLSNWGLYEPSFPLSLKDQKDIRVKLESIPFLFAQAKSNLTEAVPDLAEIAILVNEKGGYHKDRDLTSFISVFPVNNPKYVVLTILENPKKIEGSQQKTTGAVVNAPLVKEIILEMIKIMNIPANKSNPKKSVKEFR